MAINLIEPDKASEEKCACGGRAKSKCPGEWGPGCDLGDNPAHVRVRFPSAVERLETERNSAWGYHPNIC